MPYWASVACVIVCVFCILIIVASAVLEIIDSVTGFVKTRQFRKELAEKKSTNHATQKKRRRENETLGADFRLRSFSWL